MNGALLMISPNPGDVAFDFVPDRAVMRQRIREFTQSLLAAPVGEQVEMPVKHTIRDGLYMRELFIKKGTVLAGKVHKKACMNLVLSGDISIVTEHGARRVQQGFTGTSDAGIQKLGYAHEDTVFVNVFRVGSESIEEIEREIAFDNYEELDAVGFELQEALCQSHG